MATPTDVKPEPITADQGWNRLMGALAKRVPHRLYRTAQARKAMNSIRRRSRR